MPFYENGDVCIHYEETGSGFPLLLIPGGGLNSTIGFFTGNAPFNPIEEFQGEYRVIAADLRNANGGESSGPLAIDRPWDAFAERPARRDGSPGYRGIHGDGLLHRRPFHLEPVAAGTRAYRRSRARQPSGFRPEMPDLSYQNNMKGWGPALCEPARHPMAMVDAFLTNMYTKRADFVYTVTRDFVRSCQTHPVLPDDVPGHPYAVAMETVPRPKCRGDCVSLEGARTARQDGATSARLPPGT